MAEEQAKRTRLSLSTKILIGIAAGIAVGLFFGETVGFLKTVGDAFIQLLQMTVLPYIIVSLIGGLGRLSYREATSLATKCGLLLLLLWAIAVVAVLTIPLAFPEVESASFFSTSLIEERKEIDFLELYIPANPFRSMAQNIVPAVVLFSIAVGVALIGVGEKKRRLLEDLSLVADVLTRVANFIVSLTPVGVFAIAASAAGTMNVGDLGRLQVYMVTFVVAALLLSFWVLPGLVASLTPVTYKDVVGPTRDALFTAFATNSLFVVLPILAARSKECLKKCEVEEEESGSVVDVIVSTSFSFPMLGRLLSLSFVLFAGWFIGSPVSLTQYPNFILSGIISYFGSPTIALPFLLDLVRIPSDTFQLYLVTGIINDHFATLLSAVHILVLTLLGSCAIVGRLRIQWRKLGQYALFTVALTVIALLGTRLFLAHATEQEYTKNRLFLEMHLSRDAPPAKVHTPPLPPPPVRDPGRSRLVEIRERGTLRVGLMKDALPFAFRNTAGRVVGFDVEMAHILAQELGVDLEFVILDVRKRAEQLNAGYCDVIMSGLVVTTIRAELMRLTTSYLDQTFAFVVRDHRRNEFNSREAVHRQKHLKIGVLNVPYYVSKVRRAVPQAEIVLLESPRQFFEEKHQDVDAFAYSAEAGSAWSLLYPEYTVAIPYPVLLAIPSAYAVPLGDQQLADFLNTWIELKKKDKTIESLYEYWILGKGAEKREPRWSVIRNVLHWVD